MKTLSSALLLSCLLATSACSAEPGTDNIAKKWTGVVKKGQEPVPLTMQLTSVQIGATAGTIKWGEPYRCTSQLEYVTQENAEWIFTLRKGYGSFCDSVNGGKVYLKYGPGKTLQYRLLSPKDRSTLQETQLTVTP